MADEIGTTTESALSGASETGDIEKPRQAEDAREQFDQFTVLQDTPSANLDAEGIDAQDADASVQDLAATGNLTVDGRVGLEEGLVVGDDQANRLSPDGLAATALNTADPGTQPSAFAPEGGATENFVSDAAPRRNVVSGGSNGETLVNVDGEVGTGDGGDAAIAAGGSAGDTGGAGPAVAAPAAAAPTAAAVGDTGPADTAEAGDITTDGDTGTGDTSGGGASAGDTGNDGNAFGVGNGDGGVGDGDGNGQGRGNGNGQGAENGSGAGANGVPEPNQEFGPADNGGRQNNGSSEEATGSFGDSLDEPADSFDLETSDNSAGWDDIVSGDGSDHSSAARSSGDGWADGDGNDRRPHGGRGGRGGRDNEDLEESDDPLDDESAFLDGDVAIEINVGDIGLEEHFQ